jgi:hypothetical protein
MKDFRTLSFKAGLPWLLLLPWFVGAWFTGPTADDLLDAARIRDGGFGPTLVAYLQGWTTRYSALDILGLWHQLLAWLPMLYPLAACLLLALLPWALRKVPALEASPTASLLSMGVLLSGWQSAEALYWLTGAWVYTASLLALPFLFRVQSLWICGLSVFVLCGFNEMEVLLLGFWIFTLWIQADPRRWPACLGWLAAVGLMYFLGGNEARAAFYVEAGHVHAQDLGFTLGVSIQQCLENLLHWSFTTPALLLAGWLAMHKPKHVPRLGLVLVLWLGLLWVMHMPYLWATGMEDQPIRLHNVQFAVFVWGVVQWLPDAIARLIANFQAPTGMPKLLPWGIFIGVVLSQPVRCLLSDLPYAAAYRNEQQIWVKQAREAHHTQPNDTLLLQQKVKTSFSLAAHALNENPNSDANRSFAVYYGIKAVRVNSSVP